MLCAIICDSNRFSVCLFVDYLSFLSILQPFGIWHLSLFAILLRKHGAAFEFVILVSIYTQG